MNARLTELGETLVGLVWWGAAHLWGALLTAMLVLVPLILANLLVQIFDGLSATVALGVGVVGAYALNLPPWDAEEPIHFPIVIGGAAVSAVVWDLMYGTANLWSLTVVLTLTAGGWALRRRLGPVELRGLSK